MWRKSWLVPTPKEGTEQETDHGPTQRSNANKNSHQAPRSEQKWYK